MMQESIKDKSSEAFQRLAWEALKKSINGLINKVPNPCNILITYIKMSLRVRQHICTKKIYVIKLNHS